jgi:hypothetical protein
MKRCPTCDKTYDDSLRFCQTDGTPLVDAVEELDPFKTMVGSSQDIRAAMASMSETPKADEPVLDLPEEPDPNKTQFVSEAEMREEMSRLQDNVVDIPPATDSGSPSHKEPAPADKFSMTSPPIPSPFDAKPEPIEPAFPSVEPPAPSFEQPSYEQPSYEQPAPSFDPPASPFSQPEPPASPFAEPVREEPSYNPFEHSAPAAEPMAKAEWVPPASPEASWQNQEIGQNTPFNPPPAGAAAAGQSNTLAIVSLVLGILGITLCCGFVLPSLGAIVTGVMARGKAAKDPANFGGSGMALGGIITGLIGTLIAIAYWIFVLFFGGLNLMMQNM